MTVYGENEGQGKYWNEKPGQSWVAYDASMNERLSSISEILFEGLDEASCKTGLDIGGGASSTTIRMHKLLVSKSKVVVGPGEVINCVFAVTDFESVISLENVI